MTDERLKQIAREQLEPCRCSYGEVTCNRCLYAHLRAEELLAEVHHLRTSIGALQADRDSLKEQTRMWWKWCSMVDRLPDCAPMPKAQ